MSKLQIATAEVFNPFLENLGARFHAAHGGRGGMKSHYFAGALIEEHLCESGFKSVCIREHLKSLEYSSKSLLEKKLKECNLLKAGQGFKVYDEVIQTPHDGIILFQGMTTQTEDSLKSLEDMNLAWVEEAQNISESSWNKLRPTIRNEGSRIWCGWNPRRKIDAVDQFFRGGAEPPESSIVIKTGWQDNPWWTTPLEIERKNDLRLNPDQYPHIWEGDYVSVAKGAYFADCIQLARQEKRVCHISRDKILPVRAIIDIGGTGANSDSFSMWIEQTVAKEFHFLNYYEAQGQELSAHVAWLKSNGYGDALIILPHDGRKHDNVYNVTVESAFKEVGFAVITVPNQGQGAAKKRIDAAKRIFPQCFFDHKCEEGGLAALGWYHKKIDQARQIDLGPDHDWSSHGSDAFGLFAVANLLKYVDVRVKRPSKNTGSWKTS